MTPQPRAISMSEQQQPKENIADEIFSMELTGDEIVHLLKAVGTATSLWAKNRRRCPASISMDTLQSACNKVAHSTDPRPHPAPQAPEGFIPISFLSLHRNRLFTASDVCALIEKQRAEAARKAREDEREKVLEDLRKLCMKDESVGYTVFRHIQSLRQQQGGQEQEP